LQTLKKSFQQLQSFQHFLTIVNFLFFRILLSAATPPTDEEDANKGGSLRQQWLRRWQQQQVVGASTRLPQATVAC
jgi:hypothetical protein